MMFVMLNRSSIVAVCIVAVCVWVLCPGAALAQHHGHEHQAVKSVTEDRVEIDRDAGPAVLENLSSSPGIVEVELTAAPARVSLVPGTETLVYAYNGRVPGPLLEASEGDSVIVRFRNDLREETTVHWHGLHLPFVADGSPFHPVAPGEEFVYAFRIKPGTAGTYWYHPHPHHRTSFQVSKGLYGGIIIRDPDDPLPRMTEQLLILSDNRFRDDGSLDFPERDTPQWKEDEMNGREGDVLFVNDQIIPTLTIRSGEVQRWRVINASGGRTYRLALQGHTLLHVGSDGGLFEHPMEVEEIVLANGERAEVLVRGSGAPGSSVVFRTLPYDRYMPRWRPAGWDQPLDLLTLQYSSETAAEPLPIPEVLRPIPRFNPDEAAVTRVFLMSQGKINSRTMDMDRIDERADLGAKEIWEIHNLVGMDHPFHLHGFQFQVLDRNGIPEPQPQWKDTVNVPKFESATFIVRLDNFPGKWMYHCHILTHEDQGMMGVLEVE
jgi:FtsP/CotA-like multicopper oxidase with cupredoxin domain